MLSHWLMVVAAVVNSPNGDIRPLLRTQGFEWTLARADTDIKYIGEIEQDSRTHQIYLYNAVNRESGHGLNFFIFMLNRTTFLGVHEAGSAHDCRVEKDTVICKADYPARRIQFTKNGPPLMLWFDGYYERFWFAPKFRAN